VFPSGGTESNNLALKGVAYSKHHKGRRIITSKIEQRSVLDVVKSLGNKGFEGLFIGVDKEGFIDFSQLEKSLEDARMVSIQHANQEIGTIQDIRAIGELCRAKGIVFHTDAVQSFAKESIDVEKMNIDLLSMSAHLIHGPKGTGALYIREGVKLEPLIEGDTRERGLRAGSPNVPGIVGFGVAVELMKEEDLKRIKGMRDYLIKRLLEINDTKLNGPLGDKRLCNNVNVTLRYVEGEALTLHANMKGLIINTGSACYSSELEPSHVIRAIGGSYEEAHGSTRLTLSRWNTYKDLDYAVEVLKETVEKLRRFSAVARGVER
ncbi:MAG: cysteine desulfurase family protein, partial [Nitrososphaerota archaeon]